jgi:hypothetical protein
METARVVIGSVRRLVVPALVMLSFISLGGPAAAEEWEAGTWRKCVDSATLDYNTCLMEAGSGFSRMICDVSWEIDVAVCTAKAIGEIRGALNAT